MLTGLQVAVLGGDARQIEIVRKLTELDAKVFLIGFEQFDHFFPGAVKEKISEFESDDHRCNDSYLLREQMKMVKWKRFFPVKRYD